jgi:aldehyde dehydrogenase (NAD+)
MNINSRAPTINNVNFRKLYIGGEWTTPSTENLISVVSPVTEEIVFQVANANSDDVDKAVMAAHGAFESGPWPHMTPNERAKTLGSFAKELRSRARDLSIAWTESTGVISSMANMSPEYSIGAIDRSIEQAASFAFIEEHPSNNGVNT